MVWRRCHSAFESERGSHLADRGLGLAVDAQTTAGIDTQAVRRRNCRAYE